MASDPDPLRPAVVLVGTREDGNLGSAARAMANFGLAELVLVRPEADPRSEMAGAMAVGGREILEAARQAPDLRMALAATHIAVGTSSGRGRADPRPARTPRQLAADLARLEAGTSVALVFGPEPSGLTLDELAALDPIVRIPAMPGEPTLNLAQAVLVLAYELHLARLERAAAPAIGDRPELASRRQLDGLFEDAARMIERSGFARDETWEGVRRDLHNLLLRARPDEREVAILRGVLRRLRHALEPSGASIGADGER